MANGNFGGGSGTKTKPYYVEDFADINAIKNHLGKLNVYFEQIQDIEFEYTGKWEPIGDLYEEMPFMGTYDGAGYKISNIVITETDDAEKPVALFAYTGTGSKLTNIHLENVNVTGIQMVAGLSAYCSSIIEKCTVSGTVTGESYVSLLAAYVVVESGLPLVEQCSTTGTVTGGTGVAGLIAMANDAIIKNCYSTADLIVVGEDELTMAGGLLAGNFDVQMINCFFAGTLEVFSHQLFGVGGLAGGGLWTDIVIESSYYDKTKTANSTTHVGKVIPKTTKEMSDLTTYVGWDLDTIWKFENNRMWLMFESVLEGEAIIPILQSEFFVKIADRWYQLNPTN